MSAVDAAALNAAAHARSEEIERELGRLLATHGRHASVAFANAIAIGALRHVEAVIDSNSAMTAAWSIAGRFRKRHMDVNLREAGSAAPFALAMIQAREDGFTIVCRNAAGQDEHHFPDVGSTVDTAMALQVLGWRLRFDEGTDAVRAVVPRGSK